MKATAVVWVVVATRVMATATEAEAEAAVCCCGGGRMDGSGLAAAHLNRCRWYER